jgi:hypothetical protein
MRAMILAATLACAALSGCDQTPTAAVAPAAPAIPAPVIAAPPMQSVAQIPATHRHRRRAWARGEDSRSEYSESDVSTYGYVSDSHSSSSEQTDVADASTRAGGGLWVDGYGRGYFMSGRVVRAGTMRGKRLAPWKGYDKGCDR